MKNRLGDYKKIDKISLCATKLNFSRTADTRTYQLSGEGGSVFEDHGWANKKCFWQETEAIGQQKPRIGFRPKLHFHVQEAQLKADSLPPSLFLGAQRRVGFSRIER